MSQIEKLLKKSVQSLQNARYADIEKILLHLDFEKISTKGSHVKWKHRKMRHDIIIPIHSGECKDFYKKHISTDI